VTVPRDLQSRADQENVSAHMWGNIAASSGHKKGGKLHEIVAKQISPF
tara:strand:- start:337 stop:480 length:144 start_codon:yes stop_codon:yes gene_type:complete